jgi:molecular chaperone DnaK
LGHKVNKAVITVPAYFNDAQRQATKDAGQIAGLDVARIINEPTAAALAYGLDKKKDEKIIVFDLGGGTFDVSILEVADSGDEDQESRVFQVISTSGDTHLGGDDFDEALINYVADEFKKENAIDLRNDPMALQRLQEACEKAKKDLSSLPETDINLPFITVFENVPKHLTMKITRSKFEELVDDLVERCRKPVLQALKDAGFQPNEIDEIVLVGGSTRVPKVRDLVKSIFGKEPHQGVNPDEVVAVGAAIQGSVLAGDRTDVLLLDVTPLTLGIETEGGVMTALVERNTTIPVEKKNVFSTAADNQTAVTVRVFQGERKMATNNRLLGEFNLEGIPPQPRGVPQIEVKFDIDQNGIVSVSAKELKTGKEASVTIKEAGALSEDDIEQMRKDAEANAEDDRKQFELVEARNRASQQVYQLEKQMKEHADKLTDADTEPMNRAIEKVKKAAEGEDTAAIKQASDELSTAEQAFSKVLYEKAEAGGAAETPPSGAAASADSDDDAIDADYEVKE